MKLNISFWYPALVVPLILGFAAPALAHETHRYEIGGIEYEIVIGSQGEPVIVDDKTGLDLRITRDGEPLVGAQDMLQFEMIAGSESKIEDVEPVHGEEGEYKTNFIATVPTTLQYRIFGELEGILFDQTYTCNPAGNPRAEENTERIDISEGVVETLSRGNFGCPQLKEEFGFPEPAESIVNLSREIANVEAENQTRVDEMKADADSSTTSVNIALILSIISLGIGAVSFFRRGNTRTSIGK